MHHPRGRALPALEQNILKYRALEMVIILFAAEDLKNFVVEVARKFRDPSGRKVIPDGAKNPYKKACHVLVSAGILTDAENDEIRSLANYRNDIAHRIQEFTMDISRNPFVEIHADLPSIAKYNYDARRKIKFYRDELVKRIGRQKSYYLFSLEHLFFGAAHKTYEQELRRLRRRIVRQLATRKHEIDGLNEELATIDEVLVNDASAIGLCPRQKKKNGTLTSRGVEICYQLFDEGKSTLAVAHLLHISYGAAARRRRKWEFDRKPPREAR
jgi:hypothetical protein